jgi:hypothetical protein
MCGALAGGRQFCVDCDPPADRREQTVPLALGTPLPAVTTDRSVEPAHRRVRLAIIAVVLGLVVAGAAAAVVLLQTQNDPEPSRSTTAARPEATTTASQALTEEPALGSAQGTTVPADESADGPAPAGGDTGPENALREHWKAVAVGDFSRAYDRFSSRYRKGRNLESWSTGMRGFSPEIEIVEIKEIESAGNLAMVRVILATRDRGDRGDASRCHIFRGRVRVVRERGRWLYEPPGLRETHKGGIDPSSDERCEPLFR